MQWLAVDELFPHFRGSLFAVGAFFLLGLQDGAPYVWDDFATLDEIKAVVGSSVLPLKRPFTCEPA